MQIKCKKLFEYCVNIQNIYLIMKSIWLTIAWLFCLTAIVQAQSNFLKDVSIGEVNSPKNENKKLYGPVDFRNLEEMVGEKFLVMPMPKSLQSYGYRAIYKEGSKKHASYDEVVGKVLTLDSLIARAGMFTDSLGGQYKVEVSLEQFSGLTPLKDLEDASRIFKGKTIWIKNTFLNTYNMNTDNYSSFKILKFSPVTVVDISVGEFENLPVKFVLKTANGKIGFMSVNLSGSNQSEKYRHSFSFNNMFLTYNPKLKYKYSPAIWKLIQNETVQIGMTARQVKLSIGEPRDINYSSSRSGSTEQWIYGENPSTYYYFKKGVLTGWN